MRQTARQSEPVTVTDGRELDTWSCFHLFFRFSLPRLAKICLYWGSVIMRAQPCCPCRRTADLRLSSSDLLHVRGSRPNCLQQIPKESGNTAYLSSVTLLLLCHCAYHCLLLFNLDQCAVSILELVSLLTNGRHSYTLGGQHSAIYSRLVIVLRRSPIIRPA